ncbi:hypothetical protein OG21DRAFT_1022508 [Imleria badia]|nr:hypothetical protein OG21DRAFT_1022508 [Imleria badia]
MFSSLTETVTFLFNTPIVPPQNKRHTADVPLVDLSRGRRGLSGHIDSAEGFALTQFSSGNTSSSTQSRESSALHERPSS